MKIPHRFPNTGIIAGRSILLYPVDDGYFGETQKYRRAIDNDAQSEKHGGENCPASNG
jgi:hypothetical protein